MKVDLYKKPIKAHKLNKKTSLINKIPALHGHTTPATYHPQLSPLQKFWVLIIIVP